MEAMCIVFVFAALVCLGLLSPFLCGSVYG